MQQMHFLANLLQRLQFVKIYLKLKALNNKIFKTGLYHTYIVQTIYREKPYGNRQISAKISELILVEHQHFTLQFADDTVFLAEKKNDTKYDKFYLKKI